MAAAPYPTRVIGVQIAELQLKQPNQGYINPEPCTGKFTVV